MIVLDTHALIWVLQGAPQLGKRAARIVDRALQHDQLVTSAVVFWEVALLVARGRLKLPWSSHHFRTRVQGFGIIETPVTGDIALRGADLTAILGDPADCFIAATAAVHQAKLMTADRRLLDAGIVDVLDARR